MALKKCCFHKIVLDTSHPFRWVIVDTTLPLKKTDKNPGTENRVKASRITHSVEEFSALLLSFEKGVFFFSSSRLGYI